MNGGVFSPLTKGIFFVQRMERNDRIRGNRGTAFCVSRTTTVCKLEWVETGGIHKLNRARDGCVYVKVGIPVVVTKGVFVTDKSIKLALRQEESKLEAALPCERPAREGQRSCMSGPWEPVPSLFEKCLSVGKPVPSSTIRSEI